MKEPTYNGTSIFDVALIAPFSFKNALPCGVRFRKANDAMQNLLSPGNEVTVFDISSEAPTSFEISIPNFASSIFKFAPPTARDEASQKPEHKIVFLDRENRPLKLYIRVVADKKAKYSFYIYTRACIINNTLCKLNFFSDKQPIAGQEIGKMNYITPISNSPALKVMLNNRSVSRWLSIRNISFTILIKIYMLIILGSAGISDWFEIEEVIPNKPIARYDFVMTTSLAFAAQEERILTKLITLAPKYMIYNRTNYTISAIQFECFDNPILVAPNDCLPFNWTNSLKPFSIVIRLLQIGKGGVREASSEDWDWSNPFLIDELGSITVKW